MKKQQTIIFMGNSGCGKGTQAELVERNFKKNNEKVTYIGLGSKFRDFFSMTTSTAKIAQKIAQKGLLSPEFLAVYLWAEILNSYHDVNKHLILDGAPRKLREAQMLDEALKFYDIKKPIVFYIKTSDNTVRKRMLSRGRADDTEEKIERRLKWFDEEVKKTILFFQENKYYDFFEINGEQNIEEIQKEVLKNLS